MPKHGILHPPALGAVVLLGAGHRFRIGDFAALVAAAVAGRGVEREVHRLEGEVQVKGLVAIGAEEVDGEVGAASGVVAGQDLALPVDVEFLVGVVALAAKAGPVVEAGQGLVAVMAHVPFAEMVRW